MNIRKSVNSLTSAEKQAYVDGVLALKANGTYDELVEIHQGIGFNAHSRPAFLPWHREYLLRYEKALQDVLEDPNFALPYWDWPADEALSNPTNAPIWQDDFLGGDGAPVSSGPFANWPLFGGGTLSRALGANPNASNLPNQADVTAVMNITPYDSSPWDRTPVNSFRNQLEGWVGPNLHNRGHVWVGGSMLPDTSPNDPVFWLHHCMVDRLWALWQCQNPDLGYLPITGGPTGHNLNDNMSPWNTATDMVTPADVLDISTLGYTYAGMVDNTNGDLLHTIRFNNATWQGALGNVEHQSGEIGTIINADCDGVSRDMHVCAVTASGRLWHTIRYGSGGWQGFFGDIESQSGNVGSFIKVACAGSGSDFHVCGITSDGRLWHTIRYGNGTWQKFWGNVEGQTGEVGSFQDVACSFAGGDLHICAVTTTGRVLHTIRSSNGTWQNFFGDIEGQSGNVGTIRRVGCAGVGRNDLHVCVVTTTGRLFHTIRFGSGSWQNFFGDIESQTGDAGSITEVACAGTGNDLHVCAVNSDGNILHTIRFGAGSGSWQRYFGDIAVQVFKCGKFQDIACGNSGDDVHVCVVS